MNGVIQGGWEFVIAAFTVSGFVLIAYTISIIARLRRARGADRNE